MSNESRDNAENHQPEKANAAGSGLWTIFLISGYLLLGLIGLMSWAAK